MSALPGESIGFTVETITPVSEAIDGQNAFRVEARLDSIDQRLRPGMEGIAKTQVDRRLLLWIWTHKLMDWIRLKAWAWWP